MQGDRAKCIEAGADDYLAKPVDLGKLTSMLKIWLDPKLAAPVSKPS
jgi:tubulin-specific chaperone A